MQSSTSTKKISPKVNRADLHVIVPLNSKAALHCTAEQISDFLVLKYIYERGQVTMNELAGAFIGTKQNIYGRITRLLKKGFVSSVRSKPILSDGNRRIRYSINPEAIKPWNAR